MDPLVFLLVAGAAVLHVTWNVLLKTAGDPLRAAAVGMGTAAAVLCPTALVAWLVVGRPAIPTEVLALSVASGVLEAVYFAFLAAAYRRGDLSLVYPLARGSAPLLAVAIGVIVLGERLGPIGDLGVVALLGGILSLQQPWRYLRASGRESGPAAGFALLTGITIASYSAVDRVGVRGTMPWIYAGLIWASCTTFLWAYVWVYRRWRSAAVVTAGAGTAVPTPVGPGGDLPDDPSPIPDRSAIREASSVASQTSGAGQPIAAAGTETFSSRRAGVGGLITLAGYLMILTAFTVAPLTAVAPLRESAVVLASGWGAFRLREARTRGDGLRRLASAGLVVAGAILLAID